VRKLYDHLRAVKEASVGRTLPVAAAQPRIAAPQAESLDQELDDAAQAVRQVRPRDRPESSRGREGQGEKDRRARATDCEIRRLKRR